MIEGKNPFRLDREVLLSHGSMEMVKISTHCVKRLINTAPNDKDVLLLSYF